MANKKIILFWTCLLLGIVLVVIAARFMKGRPTVTIISPETEKNQPVIKVVRVIDGDTVEVEIEGKKESVRLIGIDAPEEVDTKKPIECFAREASEKMKELLTDKTIYLIVDESQTDRDIYGRLLRYVFLQDRTDVGQLMIAGGFAREYTFRMAYEYQTEYRRAQMSAEENGRGLWSACKEPISGTSP